MMTIYVMLRPWYSAGKERRVHSGSGRRCCLNVGEFGVLFTNEYSERLIRDGAMSLYQSFVVKGELCIKAELLIYESSMSLMFTISGY